ncbi:ABC transporter ATP-binding protein [Bradyrhizobium sp. RD5-C2]|uniref:ABC transporter ATP-binding protein n=1 Tax=Bradyrhizobium sp. RD5-C2 TaxID=244562 RepID=UPI001CC676AC|nr:ABC transporter ATP-binding protein [Bradyrhizobium sp. RD5-C2]GIQ76930.1 ABC transporter ATP-binding protein [Bradyrhizobium sp. RD5-C2]
MTALLSVRDVEIDFGGIRALQGISFDVQRGEICGLIGPNGAGKTSLFNAISRVYPVDRGSIHFDGRDITALPANRIIALGIARTLQNVGLFSTLSVKDNVLLGAHHRVRPGFIKAILGRGLAGTVADPEAEACALLHDLGLGEVRDHLAGGLPFGTLKRIELARALISHPRFLMLDEPANGLSHGEVDELADVILQVRKRYDLTVLIVEHHMRMLMRISDHVVVLENGLKIADGAPAEVKADAKVAAAYLGSAA